MSHKGVLNNAGIVCMKDQKNIKHGGADDSSRIEGIVSLVFGRFYNVMTAEREYQCVLRGKIKLDERWKGFTNPTAVGDRVMFTPAADGSGVIEDILDRTNAFTRKDKKDKGRDRKQDLIAANLDCIVVMQSFYDPHLNLRFVDRIAVRAVKENVPLVLCVNKLDLAGKDYCDYIERYYKNAPIEIFFASGSEHKGIEEIGRRIRGIRSILVGYSGVGKTTMLNELFPGILLKTAEVSESTGKGKHTTTNVMLKRMPDGTELIDTPGVREFGLMDIEPHMIGRYFYEFDSYSPECTYKPCTHDHEPGCAVTAAVEEGLINEDRYISYLNILHSVADYNSRIYS
jgi:ribosome biogenesis GTPase / thiamine phosphate phosphatase